MLFCLKINNPFTLEQAWKDVEEAGISLLYGSKENDEAELIIEHPSGEIPPFAWIKSCELYQLPAIDWEAQWQQHGQDFYDGHVHVSFEKYGLKLAPLALKPGPGFGDLSHPTTHLMLDLMIQQPRFKHVIDVGCGSGILSLVAAKLGANDVWGVDIDPAALQHSIENTAVNNLENQCHFCLPENLVLSPDKEAIFVISSQEPAEKRSLTDAPLQPAGLPDKIMKGDDKEVLILLNMISSEQQVAWAALPALHSLSATIISSGIPAADRTNYLNLVQGWGWLLQSEVKKEGWLGFVFRT